MIIVIKNVIQCCVLSVY